MKDLREYKSKSSKNKEIVNGGEDGEVDEKKNKNKYDDSNNNSSSDDKKRKRDKEEGGDVNHDNDAERKRVKTEEDINEGHIME